MIFILTVNYVYVTIDFIAGNGNSVRGYTSRDVVWRNRWAKPPDEEFRSLLYSYVMALQKLIKLTSIH